MNKMAFVDVDQMLFSIVIQWSNCLTLIIWLYKTDTFNKVII